MRQHFFIKFMTFLKTKDDLPEKINIFVKKSGFQGVKMSFLLCTAPKMPKFHLFLADST